MSVASTAGIAMSLQAVTGKQNMSLQMVKHAAEQQQQLAQMLAESTASINAYRGNNVNIMA